MSAIRALNDLTRRMGDERAGEFAQYCGLLLRSKGDLALAQRMAGNASERVQAVFKTAVARARPIQAVGPRRCINIRS
jgi:hypothetical protein